MLYTEQVSGEEMESTVTVELPPNEMSDNISGNSGTFIHNNSSTIRRVSSLSDLPGEVFDNNNLSGLTTENPAKAALAAFEQPAPDADTDPSMLHRIQEEQRTLVRGSAQLRILWAEAMRR